MGRLAIAAGNTLLGAPLAGEAATVDVGGRPVQLLERGSHALLQRHGNDGYALPHAIDHVANMRALAERGCDRVLALGSVGSLRPELPIGSFVACDDFIALGRSASISDGYEAHAIAGFDRDWRARILAAWGQEGAPELVDRGVYWQSSGPRFETPAEVRIFAAHAHVVGMTIASECAVAGELGLAYAAICVVDNMAAGVGSAQLTVEEFEAGKRANRERLLEALARVVPRLAS